MRANEMGFLISEQAQLVTVRQPLRQDIRATAPTAPLRP